jgi:phosphomannomutase
VLEKGAVAGIMVTASHNPKDDNGYKVYWDNGCQIVSPHDKGIAQCIDENLEPWNVGYVNLASLDASLLSDPKEEITESYYRKIAERYSHHKNDTNSTVDLKSVYTPMHGVGLPWAEKAFQAFNLKPFIPVQEQMHPDPEFPTVAFPNPEEGQGALVRRVIFSSRLFIFDLVG